MGWQPGAEHGTDGEPAPSAPGRDPRLSGFARGGEWDSCPPPSADLAAALEASSGTAWRCPGAGHDELLVLVRQWQALESWAAAGKLGVLRALVREDDEPLAGGYHGDLPDGWSRSLTHEVSLALAMPPQSAEKLMWTAWDLGARLPGTGALLAAGTLTYAKARAVGDSFAALTDADAATAEAMIAPELPGKTYGQAEKLAIAAAMTVDPDSAVRRREEAERNRARIALRRDPSGAASLSGYDLPTDETLAAHASVCARAALYKDSGVFTGVRMDQFRAMAYLDLMNGVTAEARIAAGQPEAGLGAPNEYGQNPGETGDAGPGDAGPAGEKPGDGDPGGEHPDRDGPPRPPRPQSPPPALSPPPVPPAPTAPRLVDLVIPLSTLLGLAERPGEGHGLGPLDPGLCRSLAAAAACSPYTTVCVTVAGPDGTAAGHGCARRDRRGPPGHASNASDTSPPARGRPLAALPSTLNLTIPASRLPELARPPCQARPRPRPGSDEWSFTPGATEGPPGGYGAWQLTLPGGRVLTVRLEPVPTTDCDHRHQSNAYQPSPALRHLVQVRDRECTFPTCSRHARDSDFEHAIPYDQGGATCACNAGARSRACHQVKQSPGWHLTQPRPGWHQWTTPAGHTYTQGPKQYPA